MANHLAFQALTKVRPSLAGRLAVAFSKASVALRGAFRAAVAVTVISGTPPTVTMSPTPGSTITTFQPISVTVVDQLAIKRCLLSVTFPGMAAPELVYDGAQFAPVYAAGSTFLSTPLGTGSSFTFSLKRTGGWIGSPTIHVYASDTAGNVSTP